MVAMGLCSCSGHHQEVEQVECSHCSHQWEKCIDCPAISNPKCSILGSLLSFLDLEEQVTTVAKVNVSKLSKVLVQNLNLDLRRESVNVNQSVRVSYILSDLLCDSQFYLNSYSLRGPPLKV